MSKNNNENKFLMDNFFRQNISLKLLNFLDRNNLNINNKASFSFFNILGRIILIIQLNLIFRKSFIQ